MAPADTTGIANFATWKERGNVRFKNGEVDEASRCYQEALEILSHAAGDSYNAIDRVAVLKNLAACRLKQSRYDDVVQLTTECLEQFDNDSKALFRRATAYEALKREDLAMKDARQLRHLEPKDKRVQELLERLSRRIDERTRQYSTTETKGQQMLQLMSDASVELEKRRLAAQNLIAIANEHHGADHLVRSGLLEKLVGMLFADCGSSLAAAGTDRLDREVRISLIRTLSAVCRSSESRAKHMLSPQLKFDSLLLSLLSSNDQELVVACILVLENILRSLAEWPHNAVQLQQHTGSSEAKVSTSSHHKSLSKADEEAETSTTPATIAAAMARESMADSTYRKTKPNPQAIERNRAQIDASFSKLVALIDSPNISPNARNGILNLIILCHPRSSMDTGLGYTLQIIRDWDGIDRLLKVASTTKSIPTRKHVSLLLAKLYEDLESDKERTIYRECCDKIMDKLLNDPEIDTKTQAINVITTLLQGPFDMGNSYLGRQGIIEMIMTMAARGDEQQQLVAVEALVSSATKKDKVSAMLGHGLGILKQLYKETKSRRVKVRALVGLCRLAAAHGTDVSARKVSDENLDKLAEVCCKYLVQPSPAATAAAAAVGDSDIKKPQAVVDNEADCDIRTWAAEGLSFMSLDADVKEMLINNKAAMGALVEMSRIAESDVVYAITTILVNLVNAYDKEETMPELVELAKFAKQHVPEQHPLDTRVHVDKRIATLVNELGAFTALSQLAKNADSNNIREMVARVLLTMLEERAHCGLAAQQGVPRALIGLAVSAGTPRGKDAAAQGLARIAIHVNPETAFPGQRIYEVVRPLGRLLRPEKTGLQNFEALLALTNISSASDSVRDCIINAVSSDSDKTRSNDVVGLIEGFMFEEHYDIRRAAVQCVCNLLRNDKMIARYVRKSDVGGSDRIKLLVLLAAEEGEDKLNAAAAGALCQLTSASSYDEPERCVETCEAVVKSTPSWPDMLKHLLMSDDADLRFRGAFLTANLIEHAARSVAEMVVESDVVDVLNATLIMGNKDNASKVVPQVLRAFEAAKKHHLVVRNAGSELKVPS